MSYYSLLGVPESAKPDEIRSAYLSLIKRFHPDVQPTPNQDAVVADINTAYWVLKDSERRADYDRALRASRMPPPFSRPVLITAVEPARRKKSRLRRAVLLLLLGGTLGAIFYHFDELQLKYEQRWSSPRFFAADRPPPVDYQKEVTAAAVLSFPVSEGAVLAAVDAAIKFLPEHAEARSRECFAMLAREPASSLMDYCLAYDASVGMWHPSLVEEEGPPTYFQPEVQTERHRLALSQLSSLRAATADRAVWVQRMALSMLASRVACDCEETGCLSDGQQIDHCEIKRGSRATDQNFEWVGISQ